MKYSPELLPHDTRELLSPSLVIVREAVDRNIQRIVEIAGDPARLRPHCKTHKMAAITRLELAAGIVKHKCATFPEAEMLAASGVRDIVLSYNIVGPNTTRVARFVETYPDVQFAVIADDAEMVRALDTAMVSASQKPRDSNPRASVGVLLDIDSGLGRTGVSDPEAAARVYEAILESTALQPLGLHAYDGQNHQTDMAERTTAVMQVWKQVTTLRDQFVARGWPVPKLMCGATGSFPILAKIDDPALELCPGTIIFHDTGYNHLFPEMAYEPAAWILTRVISRPTPTRMTLDIGNKAVGADPPKGQRLWLPEVPDAVQVLHNEEHLVLETPLAAKYKPGDVLFAIPRHVCPTVALHKWVYVAERGEVVDRWDVTARDRQLTI